MQNLLRRDSVQQLISRAEPLRPDSKPLWGSMTATEMLLHCNLAHAELLNNERNKITKKTSLKQLLVRWVVLYLMPTYPKNAKAPSRLRVKELKDPGYFEEEKKKYSELLRKFPELVHPVELHHPYFGNLSPSQWGLAMWKHADHHLRQFGL